MWQERSVGVDGESSHFVQGKLFITFTTFSQKNSSPLFPPHRSRLESSGPDHPTFSLSAFLCNVCSIKLCVIPAYWLRLGITHNFMQRLCGQVWVNLCIPHQSSPHWYQWSPTYQVVVYLVVGKKKIFTVTYPPTTPYFPIQVGWK